MFSKFLKVLDNHSHEIFDIHMEYIRKFITLDFNTLYCDGTVFEAHNNRHKIITDNNINRSNKKWENVINNLNSDEQLKQIAKNKLELNIERVQKLAELKRTSYGRTDEDCVILKDIKRAFIAGYDVQFIEEGNMV